MVENSYDKINPGTKFVGYFKMASESLQFCQPIKLFLHVLAY